MMRAAILLAFIGGYFMGALAQEAREATRFDRRALRSRCTRVPLPPPPVPNKPGGLACGGPPSSGA
jgi:hypothetical protein